MSMSDVYVGVCPECGKVKAACNIPSEEEQKREYGCTWVSEAVGDMVRGGLKVLKVRTGSGIRVSSCRHKRGFDDLPLSDFSQLSG